MNDRLTWLRQTTEMQRGIAEVLRKSVFCDEDEPWRISENYVFFVHHPIFCALCESQVPSKEVIVVNKKTNTITHVWDKDGKQLPYAFHPHADARGKICFGEIPHDQIAAVLFTNHNPKSTYSNYVEWLKRQGHECPLHADGEDDTSCCENCGDVYEDASEYWFGWSDIHDQFRCRACYEDHIITCVRCEQDFDEDADMNELGGVGAYCQRCTERYLSYCDICEEYYLAADMVGYVRDLGSICKHCFEADTYQECDDCGDLLREQDVHSRNGQVYCPSCEYRHPEEEPEPLDEGANDESD